MRGAFFVTVTVGALLLVGAGSACGQLASVPDSACPPAPIRGFPFPATCSGHPSCAYFPPRNFGLSKEDPINVLECGCHRGEWICVNPLVGRTRSTPLCPPHAAEGASCEWLDAGPPGDRFRNAECLVLGPNAALDAGIIDGEACACDFPGPIWRCVAVATLK